MNLPGVRLAVTRRLKVHRGEESRILSFFVLHVLLSVVIGMISTVVDPLIITHRATGSSAGTYGSAAFVLLVIGLLYAGVTDRLDKRRLFALSLFISLLICLSAGVLLFLHDALGGLPFLLPVLFVWRFVVGILLLLIFWDLAPFFFNARQGKRLFPLLAMGGAIGYSGGSLAAVPLAGVLSLGFQLLVIAAVTALCIASFLTIRKRFTILESPRYRDKSISQELREGMQAFSGNRFLRAVGWNTILFGFLSGLIILTYNAVIDARTATGSEAASLMGIQRAGVTLLQAVVLTKVMSQTSLGGPHRKAVVTQVLFFTVGIVAFAISMVGVADFTRQIEVALMSPAAMAAFAFLPSRYRGRVMVLNNVGAAAVGIMAATVFVHILGDYVDPLWFIYPIGVLMIARLGFNFVLDRRYVALLSESLLADNRLNLARIEENTGSILQDEHLLRRLLEETRVQNPSIRVFIAGRLARGAQIPEDVERIRPFFELEAQSNEALEAMRIEMLARVDHDRYAEEIEQGTQSPFSSVRIAARLAVITRRINQDPDTTPATERIKLVEEFRRTGSNGTDQEFLDTGNLVLRLENTTGHPFLDGEWEELSTDRQDLFLQVVMDNPNTRYFSLLVSSLQQENRHQTALKGLLGLPEPFLLENRARLASLGEQERLPMLKEMQRTHPVFTREESSDLLESLLEKVPEDFETLFGMLDQKGVAITDAALLVLSDSAPTRQSLHLTVERATIMFADLFPYVFSLRLNTPGLVRSRYSPLFTQLLDEILQRLSVLVLTLSCIALPKEDDRLLARSICREMRDRTVPVKQNALEFLETRMTGDTGKYLLLHYENLTQGEKQVRLRPLIKNRKIHHDQIRSALHTQYLSRKDTIAAEIINAV